MRFFHEAAEGELEPFILVVEGSIPEREEQDRRLLGRLRHRPDTGQPIPTCDWIDRLAPRRPGRSSPPGTCATYGGIHAMAGNPTGCMGLADYLGWQWKSKAGIPIVCVPGCPVQPDNFMETLLYLLHQAAGRAPMIPLDDALAADLAFRPRRCTRAAIAAATTSRPISPTSYGRASASSSSAAGGRWCSATSASAAGWAASAAVRMSAASASAARCRVSPTSSCRSWTSRPAPMLSSQAIQTYGRAIRALRPFTQASMNKEPAWRGSRARKHRHEATRPRNRRWQKKLVEMSWDPITRIVGSLGIHTKIDFANRRVVECHSTSSIFRGYSVFMRGKDPRDAHFITSRICGICGDNHATCAVYAQNMAFGIKPPPWPNGSSISARRPSTCSTTISFRTIWSASISASRWSRRPTPASWPRRREPRRRTRDLHGYRTIADIMRALNPFTGAFYLEALQMSRLTREMFCLMEGRHVHPSTLYPGGVGTVPSVQLFKQYVVAQ